MSTRLLIAPLAVAALFATSACDQSPGTASVEGRATATASASGELAVSAASVRLNANPAAPSAAYFTLTGGAVDRLLTGASSPDLERAELHESRMEGGVMSMAALAEVPVPAGGRVEFRQGGKHVMLFGISDAAREAGRLTLTLAFADGGTVPVTLDLAAGTAATAASDEHSGH